MDLKRYPIGITGRREWMRMFKQMFNISAKTIQIIKSDTEPFQVKTTPCGIIYVENKNFYLAGYVSTEVDCMFPCDLQQVKAHTVCTLYAPTVSIDFTRGSLYSLVFWRVDILHKSPCCIYDSSRVDMATGYTQWEKSRLALLFCFHFINVDMALLIEKEIELLNHVAEHSDLILLICQKLKLTPPTIYTLSKHIKTEYNKPVGTVPPALETSGLLDILRTNISQRWHV
jgi:hypothetical protein